MNTGDTLPIELADDGAGRYIVVNVVLDERVLPDSTYGQYDSGWLAYPPNAADDAEPYFLSDSGIVYQYGTDHEIGVCIPLEIASRNA